MGRKRKGIQIDWNDIDNIILKECLDMIHTPGSIWAKCAELNPNLEEEIRNPTLTFKRSFEGI